MESLAFTKMEGAGNDYVFVDATNEVFDLEQGGEVSKFVADRHFGVGSDGLIVLAPSSCADVRMVMWNADGSRGSMCGNGIRCLAKLAFDHGVVTTDSLRVETDAGVREVSLLFDGDGAVVGACVDMGTVRVDEVPRTARIAGRSWTYHVVDVGNAHAVMFVEEDPAELPVLDVGTAMQTEPGFSDGVNVEFVRVRPGGLLVQRTFERGSGETQACGSGATAAACAAMALGLVADEEVTVQLLGGRLVIRREGARVVMEGPARSVFSGQIAVPIT